MHEGCRTLRVSRTDRARIAEGNRVWDSRLGAARSGSTPGSWTSAIRSAVFPASYGFALGMCSLHAMPLPGA